MNRHRVLAGIVAAFVAMAMPLPAWAAEPADVPAKVPAKVPAHVPADVPAAPPARVEAFSPQGTTRQVRQATARFTTPIVALGDPWLKDPFTVQCPAGGKGRWADGRNWVYDFDADLPAGIQCRFALTAGLEALDGRVVEAPRIFSFDTGGPAIIASFPREAWEAIDEEQIFLLKLDAPATVDSIERHSYCVVEGLAERVPLEVLTGDARRDVLAQRAALGYAYYQLLWKSGRQTGGAAPRDEIARIASPANGMVIAIDPDIPAPLQRLPFRARGTGPAARFVLDGKAVGSAGQGVLWAPQAGAHRLVLEDAGGAVLDQILFTVR